MMMLLEWFWPPFVYISVITNCEKSTHYLIYMVVLNRLSSFFSFHIYLLLQHSSFVKNFDWLDKLTQPVEANTFEFEGIEHN